MVQRFLVRLTPSLGMTTGGRGWNPAPTEYTAERVGDDAHIVPLRFATSGTVGDDCVQMAALAICGQAKTMPTSSRCHILNYTKKGRGASLYILYDMTYSLE